jgi:hypothetical protein
MAIEDITDPDAVLRALAEFDQLGHEALRHKYGFGKAVRWYLEHNGRLYDTKAVLGVAHKYQFGDALGPRNFYGGAPTNNVLKRLGFTVVNTDEMAPLASGATGFWIFAARPDRYRLLDSVRELDEDEWRTAGSDVRAGDRVAVSAQHRAEPGIRRTSFEDSDGRSGEGPLMSPEASATARPSARNRARLLVARPLGDYQDIGNLALLFPNVRLPRRPEPRVSRRPGRCSPAFQRALAPPGRHRPRSWSTGGS